MYTATKSENNETRTENKRLEQENEKLNEKIENLKKINEEVSQENDELKKKLKKIKDLEKKAKQLAELEKFLEKKIKEIDDDFINESKLKLGDGEEKELSPLEINAIRNEKENYLNCKIIIANITELVVNIEATSTVASIETTKRIN